MSALVITRTVRALTCTPCQRLLNLRGSKQDQNMLLTDRVSQSILLSYYRWNSKKGIGDGLSVFMFDPYCLYKNKIRYIGFHAFYRAVHFKMLRYARCVLSTQVGCIWNICRSAPHSFNPERIESRIYQFTPFPLSFLLLSHLIINRAHYRIVSLVLHRNASL